MSFITGKLERKHVFKIAKSLTNVGDEPLVRDKKENDKCAKPKFLVRAVTKNERKEMVKQHLFTI